MQPKGIFCISLDFELHWGVFDKQTADASRDYFLNTRKHIDRMLALFEQYEIRATWATVGALNAKNQSELAEAIALIDAQYSESSYLPSMLIENKVVGANEQEDPLHFANAIIATIGSTVGQEIGSHTYSHFYTLEPGSTLSAFQRDLALSIQSLQSEGQEVKSLVFPRNQYSDEHLEICAQEGIAVARINPEDWFWQTEAQSKERLNKKVIRTLDHYFILGKDTTFNLNELEKKEGQPLLLPASRFFRPYSAIDKAFGKRKLQRILQEMSHAAKHNKVYHLWWHPHNFSVNPAQSFSDLEIILAHFQTLKDAYKMESHTMGEIAYIYTELNG